MPTEALYIPAAAGYIPRSPDGKPADVILHHPQTTPSAWWCSSGHAQPDPAHYTEHQPRTLFLTHKSSIIKHPGTILSRPLYPTYPPPYHRVGCAPRPHQPGTTNHVNHGEFPLHRPTTDGRRPYCHLRPPHRPDHTSTLAAANLHCSG